MQSRIDELESCFKNFSNVPKEAIVKNDMLRLGLKFSQAALDKTEGSRVKSYRLFTYDKVKYDQLGEEPFKAPEDLDILGGPYDLRKTRLQVRFNINSPYRVDVIDGDLGVYEDGSFMAKVSYPPAPDWFFKTFEDGTKYCDILAFAGPCAFITVYRSCQFWGEKEECKFCDINENLRQGSKHGKFSLPKAYKPVDQVVKAAKEAVQFKEEMYGEVRLKPYSFLITGGVILGEIAGKNEENFFLQYVEAIRNEAGGRLPIILQTAPKDKETLKRYRAVGVDVHHGQIEVWDKDLFKMICPGKERYVGRDEWIRRVVDSVDIFGEGNVTPGLVAGVELAQPYGFKTISSGLKSMKEGFEFLMSHGVVVRYNQWNISPLSALAKNEPPPLEYFVRLDQLWCETWRKYNLPLPRGLGRMGPGLALLSHSAFMDMDPVIC